MLIALLVALAACLGCSSSGFDKTPQIQFANISGIYTAEVNAQGLGHLVLSLERVENTRTVYTAEMVNSEGDAELGMEAIGTLANDHLILNFDRGKTSDFYFESTVTESEDGFVELSGQFVFPDSPNNLAVVFSQPLSAK